jgi:hypothetical protein
LISLSINFRCLREAHSLQAALAFNINFSADEGSRSLIQYLSQSIQQKPNAGDNPTPDDTIQATSQDTSLMRGKLRAVGLIDWLDDAP